MTGYIVVERTPYRVIRTSSGTYDIVSKVQKEFTFRGEIEKYL